MDAADGRGEVRCSGVWRARACRVMGGRIEGVVEYSDGTNGAQINCDNFWCIWAGSRAALGEEGQQDTNTRAVRQP